MTALSVWAVRVASCRPSCFRAPPFQWGHPGGQQAQPRPLTFSLTASLLPAHVQDHALGLGTPAPPALNFPPTLWPHVLPERGLPTCLLRPTALTGLALELSLDKPWAADVR